VLRARIFASSKEPSENDSFYFSLQHYKNFDNSLACGTLIALVVLVAPYISRLGKETEGAMNGKLPGANDFRPAPKQGFRK
jgi:hypothetical protein